MNTELIVQIFQFVVGIALLIIVHELGHFFAARLLKVEVEEFGIGFPPRALTLFTWQGTRFSLNWIPLGGFVRPKGENDPDVPGGLAASSPWVRLGVLVAGPLANLLTAVVLTAIIITRTGVPIVEQVTVTQVAPGSPAESAGLVPGDLLTQVNERKVDSAAALQAEVRANLGKEIRLIYQRSGETFETNLTPRLNPPQGQGAIGIIMGNPTRQVSLLAALPLGVQSVVNQGTQVLVLPVRLIGGQVAPEESRLVGFKGMFDLFQVVTSEPQPSIPAGVLVMNFFSMISISLGVLNLLPLPALDGGRILFTLPEIILRKRVPAQYENTIHLVGFALLLILLVYINLQDFINPISLPR